MRSTTKLVREGDLVAEGTSSVEPRIATRSWRLRVAAMYVQRSDLIWRSHHMSRAKAKQRVMEAVQDLPDDATVEDVMERLYFLAKVDEGLRQAEAGETVSHEEAERRILG
jgi:predicted transcriptional regulator